MQTADWVKTVRAAANDAASASVSLDTAVRRALLRLCDAYDILEHRVRMLEEQNALHVTRMVDAVSVLSAPDRLHQVRFDVQTELPRTEHGHGTGTSGLGNH